MRLVLEKGTIGAVNKDFSVDKSLAHEYVWTTIDTKDEQPKVYYREKNAEATRLVKVHGCRIDGGVKEFEVRF